ncbi:hypothetical protein ACWGKS_21185 [Nocardiopsis sp. NPDC055879]
MPTAEHIARITSTIGTGSGSVIAPRLVLTSAHAVPQVGGDVSFFTVTDDHTYAGRVAWRGTPHERDDAALVEITDPNWTPPPVHTRWGRLVTEQPGTPCHTWGYPDLVQRQGHSIETAQLSGNINPGTGIMRDRYVMDITAHPPEWGAEGSPWGGLSGAALMCGDLVVGVVATAPAHRDHAAVEAVPAYVLHHDPAFCAVLDDHGVSQASAPVELSHLAHTPGSLRRMSPASLLEAHRQVVAFHGRDELMDTLLGWCADDEPVAAVVVHGPGGQGKTRLAYEFTEKLCDPDRQRRWATVWLKAEPTVEELSVIKDVTVPLLLVVDYAESRTAQLACLLRLSDRPPGSPSIRLLLLARTVGEWWDQVNTDTRYLLADITQQFPLLPLAPRMVNRQHEYRTALAHLAQALPSVRTPVKAAWNQITADLPDPDLSGTEWDTVLSVHMRALADLLDASQPSTAITPDTAVEGRVLAHEYQYWRHTAVARGLDAPELEQPLRDVLAAAFTLGADTTEDADVLVTNVASLDGQTVALKHQVRRWIADLYPQEEEGLWSRLQPDLLLEYFIGQQLVRTPCLFDPLLDSIRAAGAKRLVNLYASAAAHPAFGTSLNNHLTAMCTRHPQTLGPATVTVATQCEYPSPLIQALEQVTTAADTNEKVLTDLHNAIPSFSHRLREWALHLGDRLVEYDRTRAKKNPGANLYQLAGSLNNQAVRLGALGRHEEAMQAATQAVEHYQTLAEQHPTLYLPNLAGALSNQATFMGYVGRHGQALETIIKAIDVHGQIAQQHPDIHHPDLAAALSNKAVHLGRLGKYEEAAQTVAEAVERYHTLAQQHPALYLPDLAGALSNQASSLSRLGRHKQALHAITRAVDIRSQLAQQHPDIHYPDLADALNNKSVSLGGLGRYKDALTAVTHALDHYQTLAQHHPAPYLPGLASALNNQAVYFGKIGRYEQALHAITHAVDFRNQLAEKNPDAHSPDLATSLDNKAGLLTTMGKYGEAFHAVTHATVIRSQLAQQHPDVYLPDFTASLNNQANSLRSLGRHEDALQVITEAVRQYRSLAEQWPDAYLPELADSLNNQAVHLGDTGRQQEALETISEAIQIRSALAEARPAVHQGELERSHQVLAWLKGLDGGRRG